MPAEERKHIKRNIRGCHSLWGRLQDLLLNIMRWKTLHILGAVSPALLDTLWLSV